MTRSCQVGRSIFHRCHQPVIAVCQYCGRDFCSMHTGLSAESDEICSRDLCLAKHADLRQHLVYRQHATDRSNRGFCGAEECTERRSGQCSKCHALFCDRHLHDREETFRQGLAVLKRPVSLCDHCAGRVKLWSKS